MDENVPIRVNNDSVKNRDAGYRPNNLDRHGKPKRGKAKFSLKIAAIIVLLGMLLSGGWFFYQSRTSANIDGGRYQAVFLTNGQVYFGKLQTLNGGYLKLNDIYYLETNSTDTSASLQNATSTAANVQLIKLGSEIHGPDDEMIINKDQVLFFENLKNDSTVAKSIASYQKSQKK